MISQVGRGHPRHHRISRPKHRLQNLTAESGLRDAGMDSPRVLSLVFRIEARYRIELDAEDGDELRTVGELAQLVLRRIQNRG